MLETMTVQEAQENLAKVIADLTPGSEIVITKNARPIAKIISTSEKIRQPRRPGSAKGKLIILAEADEHLLDFQETVEAV